MTLSDGDRLVHQATIFELNVEGFRRRSAQPGRAPAVLIDNPPNQTQPQKLNPPCLASTGQDSCRPPVKIIDAEHGRQRLLWRR
jgi:hypothetical protein